MGSEGLKKFAVLSFDCYGTLIDWERGIVECLATLPSFKGFNLEKDAQKVLGIFAGLETKHQMANPTMLYPQILELVIEDIAKELHIPLSPQDRKAFGESIGSWPPFEDTPAALQYLSQHYKLVILSNVDRLSFSLSEAKMGVKFDLILTAQDLGSYKPDLNNFEQLLKNVSEVFGKDKSQLLHVFQSLYHDAVPANKLGIATAFINRRHNCGEGGGATPDPETMPHLDFQFNTLGELAKAHQASH